MGDDGHPNDLIQFSQYPDATLRQTYPPLPRKGGNPNAVIEKGAEAGVLNALSSYQRKRGMAPTDLSQPEMPKEKLPDDPEIQRMQAAGWM